ncbi:DUF3047 domain-containing protein [Thermodesulfobacteriota bacterium]
MNQYRFIRRNKYFLFPIFLVFLLAAVTLQADPGNTLIVGDFSRVDSGGVLPPDWKPLTFKKIKRHTAYSLAEDNGIVVVKAESGSSASGLIRKMRIDPREYPLITWQWKVTQVYEAGDVTKKEGDDYPARLYIAFEYDPTKLSFFEKAKYTAAKFFYGEYPPMCAINYIWASNAPEGTTVPNAYSKRSMMIVVESGTHRLNRWVREARNILEDFREVFGGEPPMITGVAIMTDTDNTRASAVSYYGDIVFQKE